MRHEVIVGVERRRRWRDDEKQAILEEVGVNGATVTDVARRHDITRQHIYQWRRALRRKGDRGFKLVRKTAYYRHFRIPSSVLDTS